MLNAISNNMSALHIRTDTWTTDSAVLNAISNKMSALRLFSGAKQTYRIPKRCRMRAERRERERERERERD